MKYAKELEIIYKQYPYIQMFEWAENTVKISFKEGVEMLKNAGCE